MTAAWTILTLSVLVIVGRFSRILGLLTAGTPDDWLIALSPVALAITSALFLRLRPRQSRVVTAELTPNVEARWGTGIVTGIVLLAVFAPLLTAHDPQFALYGRLRAPSLVHPLGTDPSGRDALARLLYGARLSLQIGVFATAIAIVVGTVVGVISAISRPRIDAFLMRAVDAGLAFPRVFLLLALIALLPRVTQSLLIAILGLTSWFDIARLVRGEVSTLRGADYIVATTGLGLSTRRVVTAHILPNVAGPIIVSASLSIGYLILIESGLSYLGVGASSGTPSWGKLIEEGYEVLRDAPQLTLAPGVMIALSVIGFSLIGDGVRQSLDPHEK